MPQLVACLVDDPTHLNVVYTAQIYMYMYIGPQHDHHIGDLDWERTEEGRKEERKREEDEVLSCHCTFTTLLTLAEKDETRGREMEGGRQLTLYLCTLIS